MLYVSPKRIMLVVVSLWALSGGAVTAQCGFDLQCVDGDACTDDQCINGECFSFVIDCDDNDPCTDDFCDNGFCFSDDNGLCGCLTDLDCVDHDICTDDACVGGTCVSIVIEGCHPRRPLCGVSIGMVMVLSFTGLMFTNIYRRRYHRSNP